jgi:hypothetical protein
VHEEEALSVEGNRTNKREGWPETKRKDARHPQHPSPYLVHGKWPPHRGRHVRALSGPKHQPSQLTPVLPRLGQKLRQSTPFGAMSALWAQQVKCTRQTHPRTNSETRPRITPLPLRVHQTCTKAVRSLIFAILLRGKALTVRAYIKFLANLPSAEPTIPAASTAVA